MDNKNVYIADNATVVGDVELSENCSVWYGAVIRGDAGRITIGEGSNVQDNCVIHDETVIGRHCVIGHGAIVHGCTLGDRCLVGMGSIIMNNAVIGDECIIGAGTLILGGTKIAPRSVVVGNPAKVVKKVTQEQVATTEGSALLYIKKAKENFGK